MAAESYMAQVHPLSDLMGNAKAVDRRFGFTEGGVPNIVPEIGAHTWGTLWMIPATAMEGMDRVAAAKGLERGVTPVISPAGPRVPATVYAKAHASPGKPTAAMLAAVMAAAEAMNLDRRFRRELAGWHA